jgi:hypothetical protein
MVPKGFGNLKKVEGYQNVWLCLSRFTVALHTHFILLRAERLEQLRTLYSIDWRAASTNDFSLRNLCAQRVNKFSCHNKTTQAVKTILTFTKEKEQNKRRKQPLS